ncbi:hypothetical protein PENTCL1PPCAC_22, partial [Pristionchus entomophagus]
ICWERSCASQPLHRAFRVRLLPLLLASAVRSAIRGGLLAPQAHATQSRASHGGGVAGDRNRRVGIMAALRRTIRRGD